MGWSCFSNLHSLLYDVVKFVIVSGKCMFDLSSVQCAFFCSEQMQNICVELIHCNDIRKLRKITLKYDHHKL